MSRPTSHRHDPAEHRSLVCPADGAIVFDRDSIRALDKAAIEEYGIPGIVLMENAARGLSEIAQAMIARCSHPTVLIVCGAGNNGGDGYAVGRLLHNAGVAIRFARLGEPKPGSDARTNYDICCRMRLTIDDAESLDLGIGADLIIDALFGTGLDRPVEGLPAKAIAEMNASGTAVLCVDTPSGLDANTGRPLGTAVRATKTVTFVGLKRGFLELEAQPYLGDVVVADIGAPVELKTRFGTLTKATPESPT